MEKARKRKFPWRTLLLLKLGVIGACIWKPWHDTMGDPTVERASLELPGMPKGSTPVTILQISDIHVSQPDMPPKRLEGIVKQINDLHPDVIVITGDFSGKKEPEPDLTYTPEEIAGPLKALSAPLGVYAVLGNHDRSGPMRHFDQVLERNGVHVLRNAATQAGPLVIGGIENSNYAPAIAKTLDAMKQLKGGPVILTHSPETFPKLPESIGLTLAGHTHCGQVVYPWGEAPALYGERYICGFYHENGKTLLVNAGLGTSRRPFRLFTHPTIWMITVRPPDH